MIKKNILASGLRVVISPMKSTQAVTVLVLVGAGSKYEAKEINGISHFLEHMFFKGTKKRDKLAISETIDRVGGSVNAFTEKEYTGYFAKVDIKHFDLAMDWVSDIFLNSQIPVPEITKERGVIIEEMNMYLDTPTAYIGDVWEELLYGNQPAGRLILGTKENILKIKREDFLDYLRKHYTAKNTVVCIAGNIDSTQAVKKVKKYFKNINISTPVSKPKVIEEQNQPRSLVYFKKTDQAHLCLGVRGYDLFHPLRYAQTILATILGGNMSSRLFISIRENRGLAYYVHTHSESYSDSGYLTTSVGVDKQKVAATIKLILKEYKSLKNKKVGGEELQKAKDYLKGNLSLAMESSSTQSSFYATQELMADKILTPAEKFKKIDQVSINDIIETAEDIFRPEKLNLALIGPFKEDFQKLLKL
ncbi:MAG: pitrilysin family protein [bacterium]